MKKNELNLLIQRLLDLVGKLIGDQKEEASISSKRVHVGDLPDLYEKLPEL